MQKLERGQKASLPDTVFDLGCSGKLSFLDESSNHSIINVPDDTGQLDEHTKISKQLPKYVCTQCQMLSYSQQS